MSTLSYHLTRKEAAELARTLRTEGTPDGGRYDVTANDCYGYVANVARRVAGMDPGEQRAIVRLIASQVTDR